MPTPRALRFPVVHSSSHPAFDFLRTFHDEGFPRVGRCSSLRPLLLPPSRMPALCAVYNDFSSYSHTLYSDRNSQLTSAVPLSDGCALGPPAFLVMHATLSSAIVQLTPPPLAMAPWMGTPSWELSDPSIAHKLVLLRTREARQDFSFQR